MNRKPMLFLAALCCVAMLALPASAVELEGGSTYCFSAGDFSLEENLAGICIRKTPEVGQILLGSRILCPGDVLTQEQLAQLTFSAADGEQDWETQVSYLPIFPQHVAEETVLTLSIRGKEDKAPIAEDSALETYKNLELTGKLKVSDPEGQPMTYAVTRMPRRGTLVVKEDGSFVYTPKKNKVGIDSFTYTATDPAGKVSREATVTITILKPTDATQYTDTLGKDCRFAAEWMKHTGIFVGETLSGNPCFSPEKPVTRGEFVTMLVKTLDIPVEEELTYTGYSDEIPLWLQPYLAAAVRSGLTAGLEDQEIFGAEDVMTTAQAQILLKNAMNQTVELEGETLTRGEAAQVLYQLTIDN